MLRLLDSLQPKQKMSLPPLKWQNPLSSYFRPNRPEKLKPPDRATWRFLLDHLLHPTSTEDHTYFILHCWLLNWIWICHSPGSLPLQLQAPDGMSPCQSGSSSDLFSNGPALYLLCWKSGYSGKLWFQRNHPVPCDDRRSPDAFL